MVENKWGRIDMKTISKTLYYKEYISTIAYVNDDVLSYVKIQVHFDFKEGLRFSVAVPNYGCCKRNPFKAILRVLEHESIGMSKYQRLKDDCRDKGLWKKL